MFVVTRPAFPAAQRLVTSATLRLRALCAVAADWMPLLATAAFGVAAMVVLTRYPVGQNSDGLIQTLFSIQKMTLFFWGQDRFANLLPALTMWIKDPTLNAMAQLAMRVLLASIAPLFFCALALRKSATATAWQAVLVATSLLLAFSPQRMIFEFYVEASPYGTSFALAGLALVAFGRGDGGRVRRPAFWRAMGFVLVLAAYLVNASLVLVAMPLALMEAVLLGSSLAMEFAVASLIGGVLTLMVSRLATDAPALTNFRFGESLAGLIEYGGQMLGEPGHFVWAMFALAILALAAMRRTAEGTALAGHVAALAVAFLVSLGAVASSSWVILNQLHPRYLVPNYLLAAATGGVCVVVLLGRTIRDPGARAVVLLAICGGLLVMGGRRGLPLPELRGTEIVSAPFRANATALAASVRENALDGIVGGYFDVWPAVFQAEQVAHDLGEAPGGVFGVALRGEARRATFVARLLEKHRLQFACINAEPGWCNALLAEIMHPPQVAVRFSTLSEMLPDGRPLTFFSIERPGSALQGRSLP